MKCFANRKTCAPIWLGNYWIIGNNLNQFNIYKKLGYHVELTIEQ